MAQDDKPVGNGKPETGKGKGAAETEHITQRPQRDNNR